MELIGEVEVRQGRVHNRSAKRTTMDMDVAIREMGSTRITARILDLSTHGFRAETLSRMSAETSVWLTLPGLAPQLARVVWSDGCYAGCQFVTPLHPSVFARIVSDR